VSIQGELSRAGERDRRGMLGKKMNVPRSRAGVPARRSDSVARVRAGAEMGRAGIEGRWIGRGLKSLPGSDARKVALAKFLRERTTVP
jgi:hypothetical protein